MGTIETPLIVTALSCCNRLSERGITLLRMVAMVPSWDQFLIRSGDIDLL